MRIPHEDKVIHQTFNANKIEFVWLFPENKQFILGLNKDGSFYGEAGKVITPGDYIDVNPIISFKFRHNFIIEDLSNLFKHNPEWNFFSDGKDFINLIKDIIEYLK